MRSQSRLLAPQRAFVLAPWAAADTQAVLRVGEALVQVSELLERAEQAEGGDGGEGTGVRPGPEWSPTC
jgi:hypothetical protein